jgi:hypothetical protein
MEYGDKRDIEFRESYNKVLEIMYPGYSEMTFSQKDDIDFNTMGITQNSLEIMELFDKMKDPQSSIYQGGTSDRNIVKIASIYAEICRKANDLVRVPTGKVTFDGEDEYKWVEPSKADVDQFLWLGVKKYNSPSFFEKLRMRLSRTSLYDINYETAVKINEILTEAKDRDSKDIDSSEIANPGEDRGE